MEKKKWTPDEEIKLISYVDELGVSKGIKEFVNENPERTAKACHNKVYRMLNTTRVDDSVIVDEEPICPPTPCKSDNIKKQNFFTKLINFIKRIFNK